MKRIIILSFALIMACEKNIESDYISYDCEEIESFYIESVYPVMNNHCSGCHPSYGTFEGSVSAIILGEAINRVNLEITNPLFMPLGGEKLSRDEIDIITEFSSMLCF